jgi:hypothetical protein
VRITPIQLARRVEKWGNRLSLLGLAHWEITRVTLTDDMEEFGGTNDGTRAVVIPSHQYDSATFVFNRDWLENEVDEEYELDQVIIHEWLHCAMRSLDQAIESAQYELSAGARHHWDKRVNHERENLVERLAQQLWRLHWDLDHAGI